MIQTLVSAGFEPGHVNHDIRQLEVLASASRMSSINIESGNQ